MFQIAEVTATVAQATGIYEGAIRYKPQGFY